MRHNNNCRKNKQGNQHWFPCLFSQILKMLEMLNVSIWGQTSDLISTGDLILWTVFLATVSSGHLAIPRGWLYNTGSTVDLYMSIKPAPLTASCIGRFQKISIPYHGRLLGFPKGRGGSRLWDSEGMVGIYDWKSEGMAEFHRWDFWSRKCRVSSLKTLLLWTFVVRK